MSQNGNKDAAAAKPVRQVLLDYDAESDKLQIDVKAPSVDCALDMLARAQRHLEFQWRADKAHVLQAEMQRRMEDARIAAQIRGSRA